MEKLKQRRDDRKKKAEDNKNNDQNQGDVGNKSDLQFEKMMKKKKQSFVYNPEPVRTFIFKS